MEEVFLDMDSPSFKQDELKAKTDGFMEKKFTKGTKREIEEAFKRYLLKQIIPQRGLITPKEINALKGEIDEMVKTTLYKPASNGVEVFKFKMYVPSLQLRKRREKEMEELMQMEDNNGGEEESFAPESYSKFASKVNKAESAVSNAYSIAKDITINSKESNIKRAITKSKAVHKLANNTAKNVTSLGDYGLSSRSRSAIDKASQLVAHFEEIQKKQMAPFEELSDLMTKIKVSNKPLKMVDGINKNFIEDILELNNDNDFKNENYENYENYKNRNRGFAKLLASGKTSSEIKFIRDIVKLFISKGMPKGDALQLGVVLATLPVDELKMLSSKVKNVKGATVSNDMIAQKLYEYLMSKKSGGRKTRHRTRRISKKKRYTRRR
jgi:hypothetical protein